MNDSPEQVRRHELGARTLVAREKTRMSHEQWQDDALMRLTSLLAQDAAVCAVIAIGSIAQAEVQLDEWSDLDLVVIVEDASLPRYWPAVAWLGCLGESYAWDSADAEGMLSTRMWYEDGRRVDAVVVAESALSQFTQWRHNPLRYGYRVVFARSGAPEVAAGAGDELPAARVPELSALCNSFRFKAMLAVSKVARHDLLVALHLSLDLVRDCCVLAMILRDREAGSRHHRMGAADELHVAALDTIALAPTPLGLLDTIERSAVVFEELVRRLPESPRPGRQPLLHLIARARHALAEAEASS